MTLPTWRSIVGWIGASALSSEDQRHAARTFSFVAWSTLLILAAGLVAIMIREPQLAHRRFTTLMGLSALVAALHEVNRRGHTRAASWCLVLGLVGITTERAWNIDGINAELLPFYLIFVMIAGLLLGGPGSTVTAIASVISGAGLAAAQQLGLLPLVAHVEPAPWSKFLVIAATIGVTVVVQHRIAATLRGSLERAQTELAERRRAEARLRLAMEAGKIGIWELDTARSQVVADQRLLNLFGVEALPQGALPYDRWLELVHPDDRASLAATIADVMRSGGDRQAEFRIRLATGATRYIFGAALALPGAVGEALRVVGVSADITERKLNELERERLVRDLRERVRELRLLHELEQLRDDLVHMVVHDLRSPLTALILSLEAAQDQIRGPVAEDLSRALRSAKALTAMANALLDVSRLEERKMPLAWTRCDLVALVTEASRALLPLDFDRSIEISAAAPVPIDCDPTIIRRVAENLLSNGIRHTPGGKPLRVAVGSERGGGRVTVRDEGPGIPPEARRQIFEKFGTVTARANESYHSAGLGLAFCKLAVEAHGGVIGVEPATPTGSVFWFEIPARALTPP